MPPRKRKAADSSPLVGEGLGRVAFEAFGAATVDPQRLASWDLLVEQDHDTAAAWCAAGRAARVASFRKD